MIKTNVNMSNIDSKTFHKMLFIYRSIENGWKVKKRQNKYVFQKSHSDKKELYMEEDYLEKFITENSSMWTSLFIALSICLDISFSKSGRRVYSIGLEKEPWVFAYLFGLNLINMVGKAFVCKATDGDW